MKKPIEYIPKDYQFESIKFGVNRPEAGFFLAPGLGKTSITLMIFRILKRMGLVDELLVLAKRRIIFEVWPAEAKKWRQTHKFKVLICHGKNKREDLLRNVSVKLLNYEGLMLLAERSNRRWGLTELGKEFFGRGRRIMLTVDESSKLRHTHTQRFKALKQCLQHFARRYILTGSPAPNGLLNLFGQVYTLDLGKTLGTFITQYRNEYFRPAGYMGKDWVLQKGAEKRIFKKLRPLVLRYGTDQLNLPPLTFVDRFVDLDTKAMLEYRKMEQEFIIQMREGDIIAANAAVASGKCRQIANGGVYYTKDGDFTANPKLAKGVKEFHSEKCEELVELLEELEGEPALVAYEFAHDVTRLKKYFAKHAPQFKDAPFVGGKMKDKEFAVYKKQWDNGELPVMFGNPESIAHGLNLQGKGGIVIFFALTWNLENYEQFIQRVWRQGQKRRVIVYRIIARSTVDVDMINALRMKDRTQQALLRAMEKRHERETAR
jgi:SNF2 family DNA or RNA helicase